MDFKQYIKDHFCEVLRLKTSAESIAAGFALGTFWSILPTPGFSVLLGVATIMIFKRISKISMFAAMAFWNPVVLIPIYWLSYRIGDVLFQGEPVIKFKFELLQQAYVFTRRFLVGNIIIDAVLTPVSYFVVKQYVKKIQKKREQTPEIQC